MWPFPNRTRKQPVHYESATPKYPEYGTPEYWKVTCEAALRQNRKFSDEIVALKTKKSECKCGKSDEVLAELIKLFATFIREVRIMSDASVALKGDIAALAGKVDALIARPPTEVIVPDPATEADVADASAAVKAIADKVDAALAPAA